MRQQHRAGEKAFIDYCGPAVAVVGRHTGEIRNAQVFVGVLGASSYTYVEDQRNLCRDGNPLRHGGVAGAPLQAKRQGQGRSSGADCRALDPGSPAASDLLLVGRVEHRHR